MAGENVFLSPPSAGARRAPTLILMAWCSFHLVWSNLVASATVEWSASKLNRPYSIFLFRYFCCNCNESCNCNGNFDILDFPFWLFSLQLQLKSCHTRFSFLAIFVAIAIEILPYSIFLFGYFRCNCNCNFAILEFPFWLFSLQLQLKFWHINFPSLEIFVAIAIEILPYQFSYFEDFCCNCQRLYHCASWLPTFTIRKILVLVK